MQTTQFNFIKSRTVPSGAQRVRRTLALAFTAFTTGARLIPMGDNGKLLKALAARSISR